MNNPGTEPYIAPIDTILGKTIERQGSKSEPYTQRFPRVFGGLCEYCGVIDSNQPSQYQYRLCPHFRGMQLRCSYCPENSDPEEVIGHHTMNVAGHPSDPNMIIAWCDSYECSRKHIARFQR